MKRLPFFEDKRNKKAGEKKAREDSLQIDSN